MDDDEIIIPFRRCFLRGEERTRNLILQRYDRESYGADVVVTHQNIYDDPIAQEFMLDALDNPGQTKPGRDLKDLKDFPLPS